MRSISVRSAAFYAAAAVFVSSPALAQSPGDTRCNIKGQSETYQCVGSGKQQTCQWKATVGKSCNSVRAPSSTITKPKPAVTLPKLDPKQTAVQAAKDAAQDTDRRGPIDTTFDKGTAREAALRANAPGTTSTTAAELAKLRSDTATSASSVFETGKTDRPTNDQGIADKPDVSGFNPSGNPLSGLTQGGGLGGPLADAAGASRGPVGIAAQGRGAISFDPKLTGSDAFRASTLADPGSSSSSIGYDFDDISQTWDFKDSSRLTRYSDSPMTEIGTRFGNSRTTTTFIGNDVRGVKTETKNPDGSITFKTETYDENGNKTGDKTETYTPEATPPAETPPVDASQPSAGIPADPSSGFRRSMTQTEIQQLSQAGSAKGGGDVDPNETDDGFRVAPGTIAPDSGAIKNGLIGNPGGAMGGPRAVSPSGPNPFTGSNGGGVINPTDDTLITTGGITEDPGDALGGNTPAPNFNGGRTVSSPADEEDEDDDTDTSSD